MRITIKRQGHNHKRSWLAGMGLALLLTIPSPSKVLAETSGPASVPALSDQDQKNLSQNALNLAIQLRPELQDLTPKPVDPQALASALKNLDALMSSVITSANNVSSPYRTSGIDETSPTDLRLTSWNVNYGMEYSKIANLVSGESGAALHCDTTADETEKELCVLRQSDILVLNEADKGVCRSNNTDTALTIAQSAGMNVVYGPEFFEAEPLYNGLGTDAGSPIIEDACRKSNGSDHSNMTGNAILSRFPILNARNIPLPKGYVTKKGEPATKDDHDAYCWDWLNDEAKEPTLVDKGIKLTSEKVFADDSLRRQLRYGSRHALAADIQLPDGQILTVVALHLENMAKPSCRAAQMTYILKKLKDNPYPIAFAGDMNTDGKDGGRHKTAETAANIALAETVENPGFYEALGLYTLPPGVGPAIGIGKTTYTILSTHRNPTRQNIPILRPSPEGHFFNVLKKNGIMWKGNPAGSLDGQDDGPWSATNQRANMGFKGTEYLPKTYGPLGESKLDWIFFKPSSDHALEPKFPRTLENIRKSMGSEFPSDHVPISVLLGPDALSTGASTDDSSNQ